MSSKFDISKGKYWQRALSLVDGCTPCSPGCDHCWSMAMGKRFHKWPEKVTVRPERLDIPLKTRKPTVFSVWNDLFHESVPWTFIKQSLETMAMAHQHTFLVLTKRPGRVSHFSHTWGAFRNGFEGNPHIWLGCTICNQAEADEKIPELIKVPGKRFLSIEPMLSNIILPAKMAIIECPVCNDGERWTNSAMPYTCFRCGNMQIIKSKIDAVILGGETGPGARPLHPDWVRSVRDQCQAADVPFFFKQWGEWAVINRDNWLSRAACHVYRDGRVTEWDAAPIGDDPTGMVRVGRKTSGRLLDGKEHNDLPWGQ